MSLLLINLLHIDFFFSPRFCIVLGVELDSDIYSHGLALGRRRTRLVGSVGRGLKMLGAFGGWHP
eukprot:458653-Karenia_brevis.AAC.1